MERVEIAFAFNLNYYWGACVTATSIVVNASKDLLLSFNLLLDNVPTEYVTRLEKRLKELNPNVVCKAYDISLKTFEKYPTLHGNHVTYARLLLPELMPESDYVIYCDVDFLWRLDIGELWAQRDENVILQGVLEGPNIEQEGIWFKERGLTFNPQSYICAGLSFFNLALMRKENAIDKMFAFLQSHPDVRMHDQTTLNACFVNRIRMLPSKWMTYEISDSFKETDKNVLHYSGGSAPWITPRGLHTQRWWRAYFCWHSYSKLYFLCTNWATIRKANSFFKTILIFVFYFLIKIHFYNSVIPLLFAIKGHCSGKH